MRRTGCGCVVAAALVVAVAVGAVIGADRIAARLAGAATDAALARHGVQHAQAHYRGFPFLTQLARKRFDRVDVTATTLTHDGLTVQDVRLHLRDVHPATGVAANTSLDVGALTGSFALPYATVTAKAGLPAGSLSSSGDGVRVARTVSVLGSDVAISGVGQVRVEGDQLVIRPTKVSLPGGVADSVASAVARQIEVRYPLTGLPAGLQVTAVRPTPTGLVVTVAGTRVRLTT